VTVPLLHLAPDDDVAIARTGGDGVPAGHKVALHDLPAGAAVRKYGHVIGVTTRAVHAGEHVHEHNLTMPDDPDAVATGAEADAGTDAGTSGGSGRLPVLPAGLRRTFAGFRRGDGSVGTRNAIGVLTTVNCSATVARQIARRTDETLAESHPGAVDGVVALTHGTGCGMASRGEGWDLLRRTLRGYARHPNLGALLVVGLGCEVNDLRALTADLDLRADLPVEAFTIQDAGGTRAAVDHGTGWVRDVAADLGRAVREEADVRHLVLGLQCGGSDAWSGLTANPALGVASDLLVAAGGTSVLGETPEIYGAERLLAERAADPQVAAALLERIRWWTAYAAAQGTTLDGNPSPGNKAGGITTILEKSLGSVAKAGHAPLSAVRRYAEPVPSPGLVFMDTPGYDPVSVTGMVAGGVNLICFTTGRGSVFGSRPAPTVKLATNSAMARRMADDIDLDCSGVVEQGTELAVMGREVYDLLLDVASGRRTRSEDLGLGGEEFVPWQLGAVL